MREAEEPLDTAGFAALTGVSRETMGRLEAYADLLRRWAPRVNLVSRTTLDDLWRRHLLDSAQLVELMPAGARRLVDLGSGAGFPGLVLAILGVGGVELIEADRRKVAFLREAARITGAAVEIRECRIEAIAAAPADVVTARACAPLPRLLELAERFIGPRTVCLFLKGERADEELTEARKGWTMAASRHQSRADSRGVVLSLQQVVRDSRRA